MTDVAIGWGACKSLLKAGAGSTAYRVKVRGYCNGFGRGTGGAAVCSSCRPTVHSHTYTRTHTHTACHRSPELRTIDEDGLLADKNRAVFLLGQNKRVGAVGDTRRRVLPHQEHLHVFFVHVAQRRPHVRLPVQ